VPDALLEYLLYHELLHHLLPGEGHDAEFNELEARWPDRDALDLCLATFHEHWATEPERYAKEVSG
jgi:predicted metal-dependent hydrolase